MILLNIIVLVISSVLLIITPLLKFSAKALYRTRFLSSILIINSGMRVIEEYTTLSWVITLIIIVIYVLLVYLMTKIIESKLGNR